MASLLDKLKGNVQQFGQDVQTVAQAGGSLIDKLKRGGSQIVDTAKKQATEGIIRASKAIEPSPEGVRARDVIREYPGVAVEMGKSIVRNVPRSVAQFQLDVQGREGFTPETKTEKFMFGEAPVLGTRARGEEFLNVAGKSTKTQQMIAGGALGFLGVAPLLRVGEAYATQLLSGAGKAEAIKHAATVAKETRPTVTMKDAGTRLSEQFKTMNEPLKVNPDGSITLYHGTSQKAASSIEKSGLLREGHFSHVPERVVGGDEGAAFYAKFQHGKVLPIKVDARDVVFDPMTGEMHALGNLQRGTDGVWHVVKETAVKPSEALGSTRDSGLYQGLVDIKQSVNPQQFTKWGEIPKTQTGHLDPSFVKDVVRDIAGKLDIRYPGTQAGARFMNQMSGVKFQSLEEIGRQANTFLVRALSGL